MNNKQYLIYSRSRNFVTYCVWILIASACTSTKQRSPGSTYEPRPMQSQHTCEKPARFAGKKIGNGHCVALIQACSGAPATKYWKPGNYVMSSPLGSIKPGTIVATFLDGVYPNKTGWHAAIYINHDSSGIWVWDQWIGKAVHKRKIRVRSDKSTPANSAQHYQIVQFQ